MAWRLGVDAGGSGCRAVLEDGARQVIARAGGGPANVATDTAGAVAAILSVVRAVLRGHDTVQPGLCIGIGAAGINTAGTGALEQAVRDHLPHARVRIDSDAVTAALGAMGGQDGIVAAMGTGSVFACVEQGRVRQIGGWGFLLGDEGSGAVLGRALLMQALRAQDGHCPMTPLLASVLDDMGGPSGIVAFAQGSRPPDFAALAPRLIGSSDPSAQGIMAAAAAQVAGFIDLLQEGRQLPVAFLGGLGPAYAALLAGRWPLHPDPGTALDGALILARGLEDGTTSG